MRRVHAFLGGWTALVMAFLWLPIVVLVVLSFAKVPDGTRWGGFTLDWYTDLFRRDSARLLPPLRNSLVIALASTFSATVWGTVGAWLFHRFRYRLSRVMDALILSPMIVPEVIMGASLWVFFSMIELRDGMARVILSHSTFCFPFVMVAVRARLAGLDPALEEAAVDLGATPLKAFLLVIVPYLMPAIIAGALLAFTLSLDEFVVTWFVRDAGSTTFPIKVYDLTRQKGYNNPELNAVSTLFVVLSVILVLVAEKLQKRHR